jgi:hypothetical protein
VTDAGRAVSITSCRPGGTREPEYQVIFQLCFQRDPSKRIGFGEFFASPVHDKTGIAGV